MHTPSTIWDVAKLAGVSGMTVSRVVNGNGNVADTTREKVRAAIATLRYQANLAARAARLGTWRVGLLYSNPSAAFLSAFLVGAMERCSQTGAQLLVEHCENQRGQRRAIDKLIAAGVDGVLIPPPLCDSKAALMRLADLQMPLVAVATGRPASGVCAVRIDDEEGARAITRHLLALGHTDIAFIQGDPKHTPAQRRFKAFIDEMDAAGLRVPAHRIAAGMFTYRSGLDAARRLLSEQPRPTAILAANDDMAAAAIAVAHGMHLHVPQDVTVCGFDDTPVATTVWPELTTIHQPIGEMARAAVDLLVEQIRCRRTREPMTAQHKVLPFTLVTRESSAPLQF